MMSLPGAKQRKVLPRSNKNIMPNPKSNVKSISPTPDFRQDPNAEPVRDYVAPPTQNKYTTAEKTTIATDAITETIRMPRGATGATVTPQFNRRITPFSMIGALAKKNQIKGLKMSYSRLLISLTPSAQKVFVTMAEKVMSSRCNVITLPVIYNITKKSAFSKVLKQLIKKRMVLRVPKALSPIPRKKGYSVYMVNPWLVIAVKISDEKTMLDLWDILLKKQEAKEKK